MSILTFLGYKKDPLIEAINISQKKIGQNNGQEEQQIIEEKWRFIFEVFTQGQDSIEALITCGVDYSPNNKLGETLKAMGFNPELDQIERFLDSCKQTKYIGRISKIKDHKIKEGLYKGEYKVDVQTLKKYDTGTEEKMGTFFKPKPR
ncbi:MAG: hypothetical protein EA343_07065 [Nodularia sp. (in: Bacteria)]|nr:MAG: hypothetical protein EA343_07065 [Nodularia sp. (in: cyanobacteria)]